MKCYFNLYDKCIYYEETKTIPNLDVCSLCVKAYRLKYGLRTKYQFEGFRTGVTL
jgi:hypothetical protein